MVIIRVVLFSFLFSFLFSEGLDKKISSYIGEKNYRINKNFIDSIFKNRSNINSLDILKLLKVNGLLNLKLDKPKNISITLKTNSSPIFLGYCMNSSLNSMGYSYFYISKAIKDKEDLSFTYSFNSETNIDPTILAGELTNRGYELVDIENVDSTNWIFTLSLISPKLVNTPLLQDSISLNQVSGIYWLMNDKDGILNLSVINKKKWRPKIILFNNDFAPINTVENNEEIIDYSIQIIKEVKFILITDNYNPINLRDGINISFIPNIFLKK